MSEHTPGYIAGLATELRTTRPDIARAAEDELQRLRSQLATVARFIHNPSIALDTRQGLARDLHLPAPEK